MDLFFGQPKNNASTGGSPPFESLNFNIARYNIGGGADLSVDTHLRKLPGSFLAIPGYKSSITGAYDWSADSAQRSILLAARDRGADRFEAFSNSAPPWCTITGSVTGATEFGMDNLREDRREDFADYLTETVRAFRDLPEFGNINFESLDPFNEPSEGWWVKGGRQEGCNFSPHGIAKLVPLVAKSLADKGLSTVVAGIDSWGDSTPKVFSKLSQTSLNAIHRINVHGYFKFEPDSGRASERKANSWHRAEVKKMAGKLGKKVWQSEAGPMDFKGKTELNNALKMGLSLIMDINQMQCTAWVYWQALETKSDNCWGLIQAPFTLENDNWTFTVKKQFHILLHFTK